MKPINVGLLGIGTVGRGTFEVLARNQEEITRRAGRGIVITMVADKEVAGRLSGLGYETDLQLGDAYKDFIVKDLEQWRGVAKAANIKIEN